jgi:hypothetical protein
MCPQTRRLAEPFALKTDDASKDRRGKKPENHHYQVFLIPKAIDQFVPNRVHPFSLRLGQQSSKLFILGGRRVF